MRNMIIALVLASSLFLVGCGSKTGESAMIGMGIGGAIGGAIVALVPEASLAVQTLAPLGGAAIGGGLGYAFGANQAKKEQALLDAEKLQQQQFQQAQAQEAQRQQLRQSTKLSAPVAIVAGNQTYPARNSVELADLLFQIQPGSQFGLRTKKSNVMAVMGDMSANGYIAVGSPKPQKNGVVQLTFQKPGGQLTPMTMEQADKFL